MGLESPSCCGVFWAVLLELLKETCILRPFFFQMGTWVSWLLLGSGALAVSLGVSLAFLSTSCIPRQFRPSSPCYLGSIRFPLRFRRCGAGLELEGEREVERHGYSRVFYHLGGPWADLKLYWISPLLIPVRAFLT